MDFTAKLSMVLASAAIVIVGANPASAITLTLGGTQSSGQGSVSSVSGITTINFDNGSAPTSGEAVYSVASGTPTVVSGSVTNQYAAPLGDSSDYLTIAPQNSGVVGATGDVTINFTKFLDYFGLYWGSTDLYNSISFYSGNNLLQTFTGGNVFAGANGSQTDPNQNIFVNFFGEGATFNKIVLHSDGIAFESDNHTYREAQVPEPASLAGLLAIGTFGAGSLMKRKREQKA